MVEISILDAIDINLLLQFYLVWEYARMGKYHGSVFFK